MQLDWFKIVVVAIISAIVTFILQWVFKRLGVFGMNEEVARVI